MRWPVMGIKNSNDGFTLIEMLVAVSVSSVILLMVYTAYNSIIKTVNYGSTVSDYYRRVNDALARIDSDITNLYWKDGVKNLQLISVFNGKSSTINFVTAEYRDYRILMKSDLAQPSCDIHETGYYLKYGPDGKTTSLVRQTDLIYDESYSLAAYEEELLPDVISIKFEFKYRSDWAETWNTLDQKRIPRTVRTTIELMNPFNQYEKYQIISLPGMANE